jgi:hypothetical protein
MQLTKPVVSASLSDDAKQDEHRIMTLNPRTASELAEKVAALPARYPYVGAAEKNVYLFTPTEAERDMIVKALRAFAGDSPPTERV